MRRRGSARRNGELGLTDGVPNGTAGMGIDVGNVRERLVRLFPGKHRFELTDEPSPGASSERG